MTIVLTSTKRIDWVRPEGCPAGFETDFVVVGNSDAGGMALEVAVTKWTKPEQPTREALTRLHTLRVNKRAQPVVLVIETSVGAIVFGPNNAAAPLGPLPVEQSQRVIQAALDEPTVIAARARLAGLVQSIDSTAMPGVKNSGLFANHELRVGVPARPDWQAACERSVAMLSSKGPQLIEKLGYKVGRAGAHALVLSGKGPHPQAIAVMLDEREAFDADSPRFAVSPVAYGLRMAEQQGVPWLIMLRGTQLRLYPARIEFGVGRKGLAETFFEVDLPQLTRDNAGYIDLIFSAAALEDNGTAYEILKSSTQYAVELGERLRDKVYEEIIPNLALAIADALMERDYEMDAEGLDLAYQLTLRVFFRMLFQVYAEDRKLLPYGENTKYDRNAIKTMAKDFVENPEQDFDEDSTSLWDDLAQVWRVIDSGDRAWGVPAYNGGLFASDKEINEHGYILKDVHISNSVMGPVLKALLLDESDEGEIGQIDFRSLSVREFGTIYEGLLESSLGLAEVDLTLDDKGTWIPAKKKDEVYAEAGQVYFHNTSGQRKGTGSYFTPSFVVEHLLERSLDPALDAHLEKVRALILEQDHAGAGELFFDFRVADLAMGSGHFLTSAIDHIEQRMAAFLAEDGNVIPGVTAELQKLERAAIDALGPDSPEPERSSLLRRQIARRCIYGLDINPIAVELARVSIWIHTFVRGLPMSSLDHNLVCANSLTGIGSVEEALDVLVPGRRGQITLFDDLVAEALESARTVLVDAALLAESTKEESRAASRASRKALKEAETAKLLFDAAVLTRIGFRDLVAGGTPSEIAERASSDHVQAEIASLMPAHMPVLFPEVFLRENAGFDVLIGNPPWEKIMVEEPKFWLRIQPGLYGLNAADLKKVIANLRKTRSELVPELEKEIETAAFLRKCLLAGPYPGLGTGDVDLYRVFSWRNWQLLRQGGSLGAVFPRSLLNAAGNAVWRQEVLANGTVNVTSGINSNGWIFPSIHGQYSIAFLNIVKVPQPEGVVSFSGPFHDLPTFEKGKNEVGTLDIQLLKAASEGASFPQLPDAFSAEIFRRIRKSPGIKDGVHHATLRPVIEFHATNDRPTFDAGSESDSRWPVRGGSGFDVWTPESSETYAWADPKIVVRVLQEKRERQIRLKSSAFYGLSEAWASDPNTLPCNNVRIAFRDITNATNTRTCIAALVPPNVLLTHKAPYLLRIGGNAGTEAFVLGVLSSIPLDWYARRYVELGMTFHIFNGLPIPNVNQDDIRSERLIENSGRLAAVDVRYENWAKAVGVKVGSVKTDAEKDLLIAENDALVAHMYGLTRAQLEHVFKTFHRGWDYATRLARVLSFYDKLPTVAS
ncbi:MAG: hypothetical protein F2909_01505 [Actinobacteria bacterium]|uniref:site-specific DNA-methyltransferase (adenine-specific) n=1 Tax=freshwater metagenome TaxID=449393 RepID=A0A6J7QWU2_9ZZZZ|nr:hypothetical protein [Actinomycetota bacterium]